jgi:hypothetical protein
MTNGRTGSRLTLAAALAAAAASPAFAEDEQAAPKPAEQQPAPKSAEKQPELQIATTNTLFAGDFESNFYDKVQKAKEDVGLPVSVGAWHWWHKNRHSPHDWHYGTPNLGGTYFWYVTADPKIAIGDGSTEIGAHVEARFRDGDERFRPFFESRAWLWEAYAWGKFGGGTTVKAGKIWRRFGLDWDGSWYGNVAYFDGWKLDPDWGASVEHSCRLMEGVVAPMFLQAFFADDEVNGSISGADPESDKRSKEGVTFVARAVPTIKLSEGSTLALGLSGQVGEVENRDNDDKTSTAGAVDLTWDCGPFKVFGEYLVAQGIRNPTNYVTGGPTSHARVGEVGAAYTWRFVTFRGSVSHGNYDDPGGEQVFYLGGVTVAITKNIDFYVEYVRWDTKVLHGGRSVFEDGFNFVLNWRF